MPVSRNQLVLGLVVIVGLLMLGGSGSAADISGCLSCHPPHGAGQNDCVYCHAGNPATARKTIAHHRLIAARFASFRDPQSPLLKRGETLVKELGCRRCHRIGAEGNRLATDLDRLPLRVSAEQRETSLAQPVLFMPDFRLESTDRAAIVTFLLAAQLKVEASATPPKLVHFAAKTVGGRIFEKHCGACHQLLSARWGALGSGKLGPNLSGLFSSFYPTPPQENQRWNAETLERWLKNPRSLRGGALMPPQSLTPEELNELLKELAHD